MAGSEKLDSGHLAVLDTLNNFKSEMIPLVQSMHKEQKEMGETHFKTADKIGKLEEKWEKEIVPDLQAVRKDLDSLKTMHEELSLKSQRPSYGGDDRPGFKSVGQGFVESKAFAHLVNDRTDYKNMPVFEQDHHKTYIERKDGAIYGASLDAVRDVFTTDRLQTLFADPLRPNRVRDALPIIPTMAQSVEYWVQTLYTNAAIMMNENAQVGGATSKPESEFEGEVRTATVKILAHLIITSQQLVEDAPAFVAHMDNYMRGGLDEKEDVQLLTGSGVGPNILGLLNTPGIQSYKWSDGLTNDNRLDAIMRGMIRVKQAYYPCDHIICDLDIEEDLVTSKGTDGHYIWGLQALNGQSMSLRGVPIMATTAMPPNKVLLGSFRMSTGLLDRMKTRLEMSNSHANIFAQNMLAFRYEKRIGLMVPRPLGLCEVTLDYAPIAS